MEVSSVLAKLSNGSIFDHPMRLSVNLLTFFTAQGPWILETWESTSREVWEGTGISAFYFNQMTWFYLFLFLQVAVPGAILLLLFNASWEFPGMI